jgi:signal transduction histidine kinase
VGLLPMLALWPLRLVGLVLVDLQIARNHEHTGPKGLLIALAVVANVSALSWLGGRPRGGLRTGGLAVMACAGGLLAGLQHGSAALAFPAVAVAQAFADSPGIGVLATAALALVGLEAGVVWADLSAGAAFGYPAILLGGALVGLTRRQFIERSRAAEALVAQTRRTESESRRAAALDERARIAREIHDVLAHALGGLTVQLEAAEVLLGERHDLDGALERIRACRRTAREGLEEARRAVAALRSDSPPLPDSLAKLLAAHREQGGEGELSVEGEARALSPEASLALMRAAQEALTNARRHAPGAAVRVRLAYSDGDGDGDGVSVTVSNGAPAREPVAVGASASGGYGLAGMRERVELAGGHLDAGPSDEGWTVRAQVPG